jgi:hypothetical protein
VNFTVVRMRSTFSTAVILKSLLCSCGVAALAYAWWLRTGADVPHSSQGLTAAALLPAMHDFTKAKSVRIVSGWSGMGAPWAIEYALRQDGDRFTGRSKMDNNYLVLEERLRPKFEVPANVMQSVLGDLSKFKTAKPAGRTMSDSYPHLEVWIELEDGVTVLTPSRFANELVDTTPDSLKTEADANVGIRVKHQRYIIDDEVMNRFLRGLSPYVQIENPDGNKAIARNAGLMRETDSPYLLLLRYGRFQRATSQRTQIIPATQSSGGELRIGRERSKFIEETKTIPCRVGEAWGFEFQLRNVPSDRAFEYRSEMHHPPIRQPDGSILRTSINTLIIKPEDGLPPSEEWEFAAGYEYELVPGTWTRRLFVDGVQVFEMSFEVKINHDQP